MEKHFCEEKNKVTVLERKELIYDKTDDEISIFIV
jgi:hypothetical protein